MGKIWQAGRNKNKISHAGTRTRGGMVGGVFRASFNMILKLLFFSQQSYLLLAYYGNLSQQASRAGRATKWKISH
jgi:hypothetical protein